MDSTGELTTLGGRGGQITTLGEDLLSVGVGGLIDHAVIIGTGQGDSRGTVDTCPTGRAADQFVLLTLCGVIYIKLYLIFRLVSITLITKHFFKQIHDLLVSF